MKRKISKNKGFTLIELIVVMAVILILSSFLFPKFSGYREKALRVKAIDTGRQIYTATFVSKMESGEETCSQDSIKNATKDLVDVDNISVSNSDKDNININYTVDKKHYILQGNDGSYVIKEEAGAQIYPVNESK